MKNKNEALTITTSDIDPDFCFGDRAWTFWQSILGNNIVATFKRTYNSFTWTFNGGALQLENMKQDMDIHKSDIKWEINVL